VKSLMTTVCLAAVGMLAIGTAVAVGTNAPNQGNPAYVLKVDNPHVWCKYPTPGNKVEVKSGRLLYLTSHKPIDFVTIKSGTGASVVSSKFTKTTALIKLSKDVSNYVVWTCPKKY